MKTQIKSRKDIEYLIQQFYARVQKDQLLGPVFAHVDWPSHLPTMYNFWSSILLGDMSYQGSPFPKHRDLSINSGHFSRWLAIFEETVDSVFEGQLAEDAKSRAKTIALLFQNRMGLLQ